MAHADDTILVSRRVAILEAHFVRWQERRARAAAVAPFAQIVSTLDEAAEQTSDPTSGARAVWAFMSAALHLLIGSRCERTRVATAAVATGGGNRCCLRARRRARRCDAARRGVLTATRTALMFTRRKQTARGRPKTLTNDRSCASRPNASATSGNERRHPNERRAMLRAHRPVAISQILRCRPPTRRRLCSLIDLRPLVLVRVCVRSRCVQLRRPYRKPRRAATRPPARSPARLLVAAAAIHPPTNLLACSPWRPPPQPPSTAVFSAKPTRRLPPFLRSPSYLLPCKLAPRIGTMMTPLSRSRARACRTFALACARARATYSLRSARRKPSARVDARDPKSAPLPL